MAKASWGKEKKKTGVLSPLSECQTSAQWEQFRVLESHLLKCRFLGSSCSFF